MLGAIVENQETKSKEYLYLKNDNNTLFYYGFGFIDNKIIPIDKNIIQKIYSLFKNHDECVYIEDYLNYQVYLDKKNNIKHFIKNGVEDFVMLFNYNGQDITVYDTNDNNEENNSHGKKFHIGKYIVSVSLSFVILMGLFTITPPIIQAKLYEGNISNNLQYEFLQMAYSVSDYVELDIHCINSNEAIDLIKNSNIPYELKESFANENLLNDIFPYYKNTSLEYTIKSKLKNLKLRIYEPTDKYIIGTEATAGFYTDLAPNVLSVKKGDKYKETAKHEFIHLLQTDDRKYIFLQEALAEMVSVEYLDKAYDTYDFCVMNVSMLMDTIGPKIIWETVFSGDDTNLVNILKNNLNEGEYKELISYLTSRPQESVESCQRINSIIATLYRNINNKEIRDDKNIYNERGFHIKRIYFNEQKMTYDGVFLDKDLFGESFVHINEIFPDQTIKNNKDTLTLQ